MESIKKFLLSQSQATMDFPFGSDVMVFRLKTKMFALLSLGKEEQGKEYKSERYYWLNLKCDPDEAVILREIFKSIIPGYHMNKRHWITVILDGSVPKGEIERLIENSYQLIVSGLSKKQQQLLLSNQ